MPSKTPKQANLMAACAHGADYDECPPKAVADEFNQADKGRGMIGKGRHGGLHTKHRLTHYPHKRHKS